MNRTRAYRRHQFYRWRAKVTNIVKNVWSWYKDEDEDTQKKCVQALEKNRKACGCWMCSKEHSESVNTKRSKAAANSTYEDLNDG